MKFRLVKDKAKKVSGCTKLKRNKIANKKKRRFYVLGCVGKFKYTPGAP